MKKLIPILILVLLLSSCAYTPKKHTNLAKIPRSQIVKGNGLNFWCIFQDTAIALDGFFGI